RLTIERPEHRRIGVYEREKGVQSMRLAYTIVLVVGLVLPARAEEVGGWSFAGNFSGSSNSDGTVMKVAPMLGYNFTSHFETYAGLPFYIVNLSSTATSTTATRHQPPRRLAVS